MLFFIAAGLIFTFLSILAVYDTEHEHGEIIYGFLILLGFNVQFAIIASTLVAVEVRS